MDNRTAGANRSFPRPRYVLGPATRAVLARYSRFVGLMKIMLPAISVALLGLTVIWPRIETTRVNRAASVISRTQPGLVDTLSMNNPRYFGTDNKNLPFTITAKVATQVDPDNLAVTLENPVADLTQSDGTGVIINAALGFYRQKANILDLSGSIDLYLDTGYELHTESTRIDMARSVATGDQIFHGQGPLGTLTGDGFSIGDRGRDIACTGHCKAVLSLARGKKS